MVNALIENPRTAEQSVIAWWNRLKPHYSVEHEEAPLLMVCLAAFPVAITVDLLYQLWANFRELKDNKGKIHQLPPLVVNDCILSPLFRTTSKDIFEMESDTRAILLQVLKERFGEEIFDDLASFLYKYTREKKSPDLPENYYEAQEYTALLAVDPKQAAMNILGTLKSTVDRNDPMQSIGVTNLLNTLLKENSFLAEMLRQSMDTKTDTPAMTVAEEKPETYARKKNISIQPALPGSEKFIEIPAGLSSKLMPLYESGVAETYPDTDSTQKKGVVRALFVSPNEQVNNISDFGRLLIYKNLIDGELAKVYGRDATHSKLKELLLQNLTEVSAEDTILLCFEGNAHDYVDDNILLLANPGQSSKQSKTGSGFDYPIYSLGSAEFNDLLNHAKNNPRIIFIIDAEKARAGKWLPGKNPQHLVITRGQPADTEKENSPGLMAMLVKLFNSNKQNLTYREICAYLLSVEKQLPSITIQPSLWDHYFLTDRKQPVELKAQQQLLQLGYSLFADGEDGPQYRRVVDKFISDFDLPTDTPFANDLDLAVLLKDQQHIRLYYFTITKDVPDRETMNDDKMTRALIDRIERGWRTTVTYGKYRDLREWNKRLAGKEIISSHIVLIGVNYEWVEDPEAAQELKDLINIAIALNKQVYFIIETQCNWRRLDLDVTGVLPKSGSPIDNSEGVENLFPDLSGIMDKFQKFLEPVHTPDKDSSIESRIREARKTKKLNLSSLSLKELPQVVLQLEGLISLDVSDNDIKKLPTWIGQLNVLREINLAKNPIVILPEEISSLLQLETIDVSDTKLFQLPEQIGQLTHLKKLHIDNTEIKVLNVAGFSNGFPQEFTFQNLPLINLDVDEYQAYGGKDYFAPVHTKPYAILEIHSEYSVPHFNTVPVEVQGQVHYQFYSELNTLQQLFRIIYTQAGSQHTIVYLCDEKNILSPQFGDESERGGLIYQYLEAFGKPLNLIINNPEMDTGAIADLTAPGNLNFVAVRKSQTNNNDFPDVFFKTMWESPNRDQLYQIFLGSAASRHQEEEKFVSNELAKAGYRVYSAEIYPGLRRRTIEQLRANILTPDAIIFVISDKSVYQEAIEEPGKSSLEQQYNIALEGKNAIVVLLQNEVIKTVDSRLKSFIEYLQENHLFTTFTDHLDLSEKVFQSVDALYDAVDHTKRMSLSNTLKKIHIQTTREHREFGYRMSVNYDVLKDFSLPLPERKGASKKTSKKLSGVNEKKTAAPSSTIPAATGIKPFNNKWVLVVGTGYETKMTTPENLSCEAIGQMLATEGYGLICGGWEGVDHKVCESFATVYSLNNRSVESSMVQILITGQKPVFQQGKQERVRRSEWNQHAFQNAFAVILVGGASLTKASYEYARKEKIPVIPLPGTFKVAEAMYNNLEKLHGYFYSKTLLRKLKGDIRTHQQAAVISQSVLAVLQELAGPPDGDSFKTKVQQLYKEKEIVIPDDLQKNRWGGKALNNGKRIRASVKKAKTGDYAISVVITGKLLTGRVALFLHNSFSLEILYATAIDDKVTFPIAAYEAFTLGAYTEDGETMLELDLNEVKGYPADFYFNAVTPQFKKRVEQLYRQKSILVKNDLQKNRWGRKSSGGDMEIVARVRKSAWADWFNVDLQVHPTGKRRLKGTVAFFLHDSFPNQIRYCCVANGIARLTVLAFEAFTVGAYTEDGAELEIDLQHQKDFPKEFYYEEQRPKKRKP